MYPLPFHSLKNKSDLYEEKDIPGVVKTLVALGESVPQTCPNFKGPRLDMRKFAWSTTTLPTASQASSSTASRKGGFSSMAGGARGGARSAGAMSGTGNGVSSTIRNSNGNLRNSNSSVGAGTSTGGGGVFSGRANGGMWQRGMGNEQPAMSGGDDSSEEEEDEVDDDDYYDQEEDADDVITSAMVRGNSAIADGSGLTVRVVSADVALRRRFLSRRKDVGARGRNLDLQQSLSSSRLNRRHIMVPSLYITRI